MTKSELVQKQAQHHSQLVLKDVEYSTKMILDAMSEALPDGNRVEMRGFGTVDLNYRPAKVGRNPKSGEKFQVAAKYVPHFKPGKELRERVHVAPGSPGLS